MMRRSAKETFYRCHANNDVSILISAYDDKTFKPDELPNATKLLSFDLEDGWNSIWVDGLFVAGYFPIPGPERMIAALSERGEIYGAVDGNKIGAISSSRLIGVTGATSVASKVITCGFNAQFYVAENSIEFEDVSGAFKQKVPRPQTASMEEIIEWTQSIQNYFAVAALSDQDFVIVGNRGSIIYFNGSYTDRGLDTPVNLTAAYPDHDKQEYLVAGHSPFGFVAAGHPDNSFATVYRGDENEIFIAVGRFQDEIYVADASTVSGGVFTIGASGKRAAAFSDFHSYGPARDLAVTGSVLWALFEKALVRYDGQSWEVFTLPEDI